MGAQAWQPPGDLGGEGCQGARGSLTSCTQPSFNRGSLQPPPPILVSRALNFKGPAAWSPRARFFPGRITSWTGWQLCRPPRQKINRHGGRPPSAPLPPPCWSLLPIGAGRDVPLGREEARKASGAWQTPQGVGVPFCPY